MNHDTTSIRPWGRNIITRAWRGQEPLWLVFWIYNVLVGFLFNLFLGWLLDMHLLHAALALSIFLLAYAVWILVAIWRCAANSMALWLFLARLIVIINVVWSVWRIVHSLV
ncbi:MAG: hypothetical protein ACRETC_06500 [Gammaproteobacteria bacterium]